MKLHIGGIGCRYHPFLPFPAILTLICCSFLPPPVMAILDNQEIQAAKRAAMVSTALTWLFAHLPVTMFPAPLQPMILVLQKIVLYISYIGTFISWSWGEIKSYDIGPFS